MTPDNATFNTHLEKALPWINKNKKTIPILFPYITTEYGAYNGYVITTPDGLTLKITSNKPYWDDDHVYVELITQTTTCKLVMDDNEFDDVNDDSSISYKQLSKKVQSHLIKIVNHALVYFE